METVAVQLTPTQAAQVVVDAFLNSGMSAKQIGNFTDSTPDGREVCFLVFEKYFMRNDSRASLSVICENLNGTTYVGYAGSGGGTGALFSFDWGTSGSMTNTIQKALAPYELR